MLKIQEIREIIKLVDQSSVDEFTYEHEGSKIKLKKNAVQQVQAVQEVREPAVQAIQQAPAAAAPAPKQEAPAAEAPADQSNLHTITSPMVGASPSSLWSSSQDFSLAHFLKSV